MFRDWSNEALEETPHQKEIIEKTTWEKNLETEKTQEIARAENQPLQAVIDKTWRYVISLQVNDKQVG